jgi:hypothetical protein
MPELIMDPRTIDVEVDQTSWKSSLPGAIAALAGKGSKSLSVEVALLITALITRPPEIRGFSLADSWAWLRYRTALTETNDLRLKSEWKVIDPHLKTILSDDLGMEFTTYLLALELDFRIIANTSYFVRAVTPSSYSLRASAMSGPKKSPDFVPFDLHDRINTFECKGTQQSRESLLGLTSKGVEQKQNLDGSAGSTLHHSLVADLFIPQFATKEAALILCSRP